MDAFFIAALVGSLAGYIVGDAQREIRVRRDARNSLALANGRLDRVSKPVPVLGTKPDSDDDRNDGSLGTVRGETGRRAIPRPDIRARPGRYVSGSGPRGIDAQAMMSIRPLEFDCER